MEHRHQQVGAERGKRAHDDRERHSPSSWAGVHELTTAGAAAAARTAPADPPDQPCARAARSLTGPATEPAGRPRTTRDRAAVRPTMTGVAPHAGRR